jgi:hypothetical protein
VDQKGRVAGPAWGIRALRNVPGFRSGTPWKMVTGGVFYLGGTWLAALAILALIAFALGVGPPSTGSGRPVAAVVASPTPIKESLATRTPPVAASQATQSPDPSPTPSASPVPSPSPSPSPKPPPAPLASPPPSPVAATTPPAPPPPPPPPPPPSTCGAPANPWGYNFCGGNLINSPPSNFCTYFNCIASFWKSTLGYVDECNDGTYSHSGGRQGACSYHGGEMRPLYSR